jgi:hypothetical protein
MCRVVSGSKWVLMHVVASSGSTWKKRMQAG